MPGSLRNKKKNKRRSKIVAETHHLRLRVEQNSERPYMGHCSKMLTAATSDARDKTVMEEPTTGICSDLLSIKQPTLQDTGHLTYLDTKLSHEESEKESINFQEENNFVLNILDSTPGQAVLLIREQNSLSQDSLNKALISACRRGHKFIVQALIRAGANIQHKDENGNPPLLICVEHGFIDIVRFLITRHEDINAANYVGNTALILSIRSAGSTDMTKFLLQQPEININHQNGDGYTALMKALEAMDVDTVTLLLEEHSRQNITPVTTAVRRRDFEMDKELSLTQIALQIGLRNVFDILEQYPVTRTSPLELAIETNDTESLDILLDSQLCNSSFKSSNIDNAFRRMFTKSLINDVKSFNNREINIIKKLVEYGADVNTQFSDAEYTPVCVAVQAGHYALAELLCKHGAQVNVTSYLRDLGPLNVAAANGRCDLIELLLRYNADVNMRTFSKSALHSALSHDHIDCAKLLIQHGSKMDITFAFIFAVENQMAEYTKFLFENYEHELMAYLLQYTKDANKLLISAVEWGNLEILGWIMSAGININEVNFRGMTPLAVSKNRQVAEFLIQKGAAVNHVTESINERTNFIFSTERGEIPLIQVLINRRMKDSSTKEVVEVLLENGALVNGRSSDGRTPLMIAASKAGNMSMLQILLDNGAYCDDKDKDGNTALIFAVLGKCSQNTSCLIQFSKDKNKFINMQNHKGLTPLMCSVNNYCLAVIKELIDQGADVNIKDTNGNTALLHALTLNFLFEKQILKTLINAGCDVNSQNNDGLSPLMLAVQKKKKDTVSILLDSGADVNAVSNKDSKKTAISFLPNISNLTSETLCFIEFLLERGASSSYLNPDILHRSILLGHTKVIPKLIRCGLGPADVKGMVPRRLLQQIVDYTVTPLYVALSGGNISLARYFVENLFLTNSDLSLINCNKDLRRVIETKQDCMNFLKEIFSQPMSLFKLSLVTVSSAVGACPGRENRVNMLPLPQMVKDKLLFKLEVVPLILPAEAGSRNFFRFF